MLKQNEKELIQIVKLYNDLLHEACNNKDIVNNANFKEVVKKIEKMGVNIDKFENGKVVYHDNCYKIYSRKTEKLIDDLRFTINNFNYIFNKTLLEMM